MNTLEGGLIIGLLMALLTVSAAKYDLEHAPESVMSQNGAH